MSAIMKERDNQADERLKQISEMQRRDSDANNRIVETMTTKQELTFGVRAVVAQTAAASACLPPMPEAQNSVNVPSFYAKHVQKESTV